MAKQGFCRTGKVAQALGLSSHQVRRLCETGLIKAELGPGGHWRISASEVARLRKEGVPLIPSAVDDPQPDEREPENKRAAMVRAYPRYNSLTPLSQTSIGSGDEDYIARNYPKLTKSPEGAGLEPDWFRDRKRQREENQVAAQTLIDRPATPQAVNTREQWHHRWLEWALDFAMPWGVPDHYRLVVRREVDQTLQSLQPQTPESVIRKLVEGAVEHGLRPWRSAQDTEKALGDALRWQPWLPGSLGRTTNWQVRAKDEARSAIAELPDGASFETKLGTATAVMQKITLEFQEETLRQKVIEESIALPLLSSAEKEAARAAIRTSVESSRHGSSEAELRRARQVALKPFEDAHRQREKRQRLERNVDQGLSHVRTFLNQLWADGDLEGFGDYSEVWKYANEIRDDVRAEVLKELGGAQEVSDYKIRTTIETVVDDLLSD